MVLWTSATQTRRWLICLTGAVVSIAAIGLGVGVYFIVHQSPPSQDSVAASNTLNPTPAAGVSISLAIPARPPPSSSESVLITSTSTTTATETVSVSPVMTATETAMETETQTVSVTPSPEQSFLAPIMPTTFTSVTITVLPTISPSPSPSPAPSSSAAEESGKKDGGAQATDSGPDAAPHVTGKGESISTIWMTMTALSLVSEADGRPSETEYFTITAHLDTVVPRATGVLFG